MNTAWFDFSGKKSCLFYILGHADPKFRKPDPEAGAEITEAERNQLAETRIEEATVHFGKVEVDSAVLSKLYQDCRDLID